MAIVLCLATLTRAMMTLAPPLPAFNIDTQSVSISGFSSGGFMAAQLGIAYSNTFPGGFGVFAGGPYDCARDQDEWEACMYNATPSIKLPLDYMRHWSARGLIDDIENLQHRRIYLQAGTEDDVVGVNPVAQLRKQLEHFLWQPEHMMFKTLQNAAHAFPTDFDGAGNSACEANVSPYVANCSYDGAEAVLRWLYGELRPRRDPGVGLLHGETMPFFQSGAYSAPGLGDTGFVFVPPVCKNGSIKPPCKLHVALHGCTQGYDQIGLLYINNTGYREWADTNNMIVLFPQATVDSDTVHQIWNGSYQTNFAGCFDWIGWTGNNADQKGGPQMQAIVNMVGRLSSGVQGRKHIGLRDEI